MYTYKNLKTDKIIEKDEPIKGPSRFNYQLMNWSKDTAMKSTDKVVKKSTPKKEEKKTTKKSKK